MRKVKVLSNELGLSTTKELKEFIHKFVTRVVFGSWPLKSISIKLGT